MILMCARWWVDRHSYFMFVSLCIYMRLFMCMGVFTCCRLWGYGNEKRFDREGTQAAPS